MERFPFTTHKSISAMAKRLCREDATQHLEEDEPEGGLRSPSPGMLQLEQLRADDPGPQCLVQPWWWPTWAVDRLRDVGLINPLIQKLNAGLRLTTAYSGLGAAEVAFEFILRPMGRLDMYFQHCMVETACALMLTWKTFLSCC